MNRSYFLFLIIVVFLFGSFFILKSIKDNARKTTKISKHATILPKEATVTLDKNGFSPREVKIKVGGAVRWKNESGKQQTVNSDNYPDNQLHKELNFGVFNDGSSVVYTFTKIGTYGYHNQYHPEQKGKVIVQ